MEINREIKNITSAFVLEDNLTECIPYGSGHINDTFRLEVKEDGKEKLYILQRMNKDIFTKPEELMENVVGVTSYLRERIIENGGDPERETLNVIPTPDGAMFYKDSKGDYWRAYKFITDALGYDKVENPDDFYQSAVSFLSLIHI